MGIMPPAKSTMYLPSVFGGWHSDPRVNCQNAILKEVVPPWNTFKQFKNEVVF